MRAGVRRALIDARPYSSSTDGSFSGIHGVAGGGGSTTSADCEWMALIISTPDLPSIAAWWTLSTNAKPPLGMPSTLSRPSMTYSSQSGFERSSGRACSRAAWMQNCRQSPGFGSAMWRTWYSRSNSESSTQYGWSRSAGTRTIFWRNARAR